MDLTACKAKATEDFFRGFFLVHLYGEPKISTLKGNGSPLRCVFL
jgi:hypothetical protein